MTERPSPWIHELTWPDVEAYLEHDDIVLVPIGATEQHGRHCPLMLDTGWAMVMAEQAGRKAGVLAAPPLHVGWSPHHMAFPGAITLRPETLTQVIVDMCQSLMVHGFKKFVLINGNRVANLSPMEIAAVKLRYHNNAFAAVLDAGLIARNEVHEICGGDDAALGHAGVAETSFMLHWRPELVDMAKAAQPDGARSLSVPSSFGGPIGMGPTNPKNVAWVRSTVDEFRAAAMPTGITCDPTGATAEMGARIVEAIVTNTVAYVEEIRPRTVVLRNVGVPI